MEDGEFNSAYRDRFDVWECLVVLLILGLGYGGYQYLHALRGPLKNGVSVREWINQKHDPKTHTPENPEFAAEVVAFGPESIPIFVKSLDWVTNELPEPFDYFGLYKPSPFARGLAKTASRHRRERVWYALSVLARQHPDQVEPLITNHLTTADREFALRAMGAMGDRHFSYLTNIIFTGSRMEAREALWALPRDNPQSLAMVIRYLNGPARRDYYRERDGLYALNWIGPRDRRALPPMLQRLRSTNEYVRYSACRALLFRTNDYGQIRPAIVRAAKAPQQTPLIRRTPVAFFTRFEVPADEGVPILLDHLKQWMPVEKLDPYPTNVISLVGYLSEYGRAASNVLPLVEKEILSDLRPLASKPSAIQDRARTSQRNLENYLAKIP